MVPIARSAFCFCWLLLVIACHTAPPVSSGKVYEDALLRFNRGDFQPALAEIDGVLPGMADPNGRETWRLRLLKAEILVWQGYSRDVIHLLTPASFQAGLLTHDVAARRLALLGLADSNLQHLDTAEQDFLQAETLNRPASASTTCMLLLGQGKVAALRDQPAVADAMFRQALAMARAEKLPLSEASAMGNLGMLNMRQRNYGDAIDWFNASLKVSRAQNAAAPTIRLIGNLGWAYLETGDLERSSEDFEEAAAMAKKNGMATDEETWLANTAAVAMLQRSFQQSSRIFEQSLTLARTLEDRQDTIYNLNDLAKLALLQRDLATAEARNQEAFTLEKAIGDHDSELYSDLNEASIALEKNQRETVTRYLQPILSRKDADVRLQSEAFGTLARMKAGQHQTEAAIRLFDRGADLLDSAEAGLQRSELELSYPTNAAELYDDYVHFLIDNGRQDEALAAIEKHRARTMMTDLPRPSASVSARSRAVKQSEGGDAPFVLSYWLGTGKSYVWLIHQHVVHMAALPDQDLIRSMVERYRSQWATSLGGTASASSAGQELYRTLVGPVSQWIPPGATVTIVPDGALYGLNFETLVVPASSPHYWIEDVSISVARSIALAGQAPKPRRQAPAVASAVLLDPRKTNGQAAEDRLLLLGNPRAPEDYPPLLHAQEEVASVAQHFAGGTRHLVTGAAATPKAYFAAQPEQYSIIHFVAHGTASRTSPLDSAVVLSDDGTSYNLYARQVMSYPIHARLVVISSCDSAGKRIYSTQGLVGMSWAFLHAGAREVIAALWDVNDGSTPRFMDEFYGRMAQGEDAASALRNAKLKMLHSGTVYAKPFYWAPFVLYEGRHP